MAAVDQEITRIAQAQHGVVARRQLVHATVTRRQIDRRLRDGLLRPLFRGVYAVGHRRLTRHGRWMAATLALGDGALLSHRDAAALRDMAKPHDGRINVTAKTNRRRQPHLLPHCSPIHPDDRDEVDGIPVTSVARTLLDLASTATSTQLQRAFENAERLERLDLRAVHRLLDRSNGHRGAGRLRALADYEPAEAVHTASELESMFLDLVRDAGMPLPATNVLVEGLLVDAYWPEARLVVELDGYEFHRGHRAFERDRERLARLTVAGYRVLHFTYLQIKRNPAWVVGSVGDLLARAESPLTL